MPEQRNILVLMTDQHRIDTLGCYGNAVCETPALDGLATQGTQFDNAFTPTAFCTPARASLVTGVLPFRHKLLANFERNVGYIEELDDTYRSFGFALRDAGYRTAHVGKWHVGRQHGPDAFGFDGIHYPGWGNPVQHPDYVAWLSERGLPPYRLTREIRGAFPNGQPGNLLAGVLDQPEEATFEYYLAERAIERLREDAAAFRENGQPFYLACHWFGPHLPYCIPHAFFERYDPDRIELPPSIAETFEDKPRVQEHYAKHWGFDTLSLDDWRVLTAAYWGYVAMIDGQLDRILREVQSLGLWDSTAILFSADHGEFTGAHRLHDKGPAMYDDIYRIPLVARVPGMPAGRVERRFASLIDLTPTVLELAGVTSPDHMDGASLLPLIQGDGVAWRDEIFAEFHGHHFPYPQRMIRTDRYKLVINPADVNELYDLETDPHELRNRIDHPELRDVQRELMTRLYTELRDRGDNFHHWMTTMFDVGEKGYDTSLSHLDAAMSNRSA
jgi:arylsulfatase A-like enzyme